MRAFAKRVKEWEDDWGHMVNTFNDVGNSVAPDAPDSTKAFLNKFAEDMNADGPKRVGTFNGSRNEFLNLKGGMHVFQDELWEVDNHEVRVSDVRGPSGERIALIDAGPNVFGQGGSQRLSGQSDFMLGDAAKL